MLLLAHVSDLHIDGTPRAAARAERVLAFLDRLPRQVDAVLLTGDLADHGTEEEYEQVRHLLRDRQRFLLCPGNHDARGPYRQVLLDEPTGDEPDDEPINRAHDLPGVRVLMLDSTIPGRADGCLTDGTLAWLAEQLRQAPTTPTLVAFHHPPVELHSPFIDAIRQRGEDRLAAVLAVHPRSSPSCAGTRTPPR